MSASGHVAVEVHRSRRPLSASGRVLADVRRARRPLRLLGASGQLGYGIPTPGFNAGLARKPDLIGCDMGSIDIGPTYLGKGEMATAPEATRRDLRKVLLAARQLDVPLVIGSAGSAGAAPHLDATLALLRDIARADGLRFRMAVIRADLDRAMLLEASRAGRIVSFDDMPPLTDDDITAAAHIVGQMGTGVFRRALEADVDVVIAGRACDTGIFAALPMLLGFPAGLAMHMAKIIECASLCCVPGGRDPIIAELDDDGFVLESTNPERRATPTSVAAHSLYEQADPFTVHEPEGTLDLSNARYEAVDDRRTRVSGAVWRDTDSPTIKMEGARLIGERAVLLAGAADPRFIAQSKDILPKLVRSGARPGLRGPGPGLYITLAGVWRGWRAHGGAGARGAAGRSVHHGRMHRADAGTRVRGGAHLQTISCCISVIPAGCRPPATWRFPLRRRRFPLARRIGSTFTIC